MTQIAEKHHRSLGFIESIESGKVKPLGLAVTKRGSTRNKSIHCISIAHKREMRYLLRNEKTREIALLVTPYVVLCVSATCGRIPKHIVAAMQEQSIHFFSF